MHTITLEFENEDQAAGWFIAAQALGAIPERAGLRNKDALDRSAHGRAHPGDLLVTAAPGAGRWLVQSQAEQARAAFFAFGVALNAEASIDRCGICGDALNEHVELCESCQAAVTA